MDTRTVEKVVILANTTRKGFSLACERLRTFLEGKGIGSILLGLTSSAEDLSLEVPDCDLAVSFGGDGTVLTCAELLKGRGIPILAVNMGTFGYITETSADELESVFNDYLEGKTGVYSRMMLDVCVNRKGQEVFRSSALNDVTVSVVSRAKTARLDLWINETLCANLKGDGIIIATPTGSTAYSLSAGGPILDANLDAIIINPICPFTMGARPLVVGKDNVILMKIPKQNTDLSLTCDGHEVFPLTEYDTVTIRKSADRALLVRNPGRSFIEVLRDKLSWAGGFNA